MDRNARCEGIAQLTDAEIGQVFAEVTAGGMGFSVVDGPTIGMIMARAIEGANGEVFNVGEVLVSECRVEIDGHEGWCMLIGSRPEAALGGAVIDAAVVAGVVPAATVDAHIARFVEDHNAARAAANQELATTRVTFATQ